MKIKSFFIGLARRRAPDVVIGGLDNPYLFRWFFIPRNPFLNIYIHLFLRSDDDRALHDHPWVNASLLLDGSYKEHIIKRGGIHKKIERNAGDWVFRLSGKYTHRVELHKGNCWTLFITGPRYRSWGFHCPYAGWVHWRDFTNPNDPGDIGRGCDQ